MKLRNRELATYAAILCFLAGSVGCSQRTSSGSKEFLSRRGDTIPEAKKPYAPSINDELPTVDSQLVLIPQRSVSRIPAAEGMKISPKLTTAEEIPVSSRVVNSGMGFDSRTCGSPEFPGQHPRDLQFTQAQWRDTDLLFTHTKKDLLRWLVENHSRFSQDSASLMEHRLQTLRIEKPNTMSEPDLAWRGIGIASQDQNGGVIRVSPGFIELMQRQPERARFEMVRLMAQDWSPCMLARDTRDNAWEPFLSCMGMEKSADGCGKGEYSEAAWAVSSALATVITHPGCTVPAFSDSAGHHCVVRYVLPPSSETRVRGLAQAKADQESK